MYESGTLETKPTVLPLSIGDGELCETALTTVSVPEMFQYWLQGERITVGFLGGAQVDRFGNLNSTVIGAYATPKVRLPGSGGATEIATSCQRIYIVMRHNPAGVRRRRSISSRRSGTAAPGASDATLGVRTAGPALLVTDLCTMKPDPETKEFHVVRLHPGVTAIRCGRKRAGRWSSPPPWARPPRPPRSNSRRSGI